MANTQKISKLLENFDIRNNSLDFLNKNGTPILVNEATIEMKGKLFCPKCGVGVFRNPSDGIFSNGRVASFSHKRSDIKCIWRSKRNIGLDFKNESEAKHLIESDQLAIVSGFMQEKPPQLSIKSDVYNQTPTEDEDGNNIDLPIPRHKGETISLPSKIISINGICRNFDKNYEKFFVLPNSTVAKLLSSILVPITSFTNDELDLISSNEDQTQSLYYGLITKVEDFQPKRDTNVRLIYLKSHNSVKDFCLRGYIGELNEHGLTEANIGQYLIMWGKISARGIGYSINHPNWGEYGTLPLKYNELLD